MDERKANKWTCANYDRANDACRVLRDLCCDRGPCSFHITPKAASAARYASLARRVRIGAALTDYDKGMLQ